MEIRRRVGELPTPHLYFSNDINQAGTVFTLGATSWILIFYKIAACIGTTRLRYSFGGKC